jgi:transglutaminase-like putative cysteine protease
MRLSIEANAVYEMTVDTPTLLQFEASPLPSQRILQENLTFSPDIATEEFTDIFGNRNRRFAAPPGQLQMHYEAQVELDDPVLPEPDTPEVSLAKLPPDVLAMTFPSRYCESDRLAKVAADLFCDTPPGAARVQSICDWLRNHVTYEYGHTNSGTSAFDTSSERIGVCRDFSHLAIAFCRAMNLPARYAAGYCLELDPPDFHAYFQVYLAAPKNSGDEGASPPGQWYSFDATYERLRRGLVNISVGRDAVDTSMLTFFGSAMLIEQSVNVREIEKPPATQ